jgi:carbon-monoxide dehydrogenase medium subunit
MIAAQFEYSAPDTVSEVVVLLKHRPGARVLAGGHDLLAQMKQRRLSPTLLVDLRNLKDLVGISPAQAGGGVWIGAMTSCAAIAEDAWVQANAGALAEAALSMGDAQMRNVATIGGNLAYSDPAADLPAALLALDGIILVSGPDGARTIPITDFFRTAHVTALQAAEIITGIELPAAAARSASAYAKQAIPSNCYPLCGVAARVTLAADGAVAACRVAATGISDHPLRLATVEGSLEGTIPSAEAIAAACGLAGQGITFTSDLYGSGEYRAHLARVLARRALSRAVAQAGGNYTG